MRLPTFSEEQPTAATAALLVLNRGLDYYDGWVDVIVYPDEFVAEYDYVDEAGVDLLERHVDGQHHERQEVVREPADHGRGRTQERAPRAEQSDVPEQRDEHARGHVHGLHEVALGQSTVVVQQSHDGPFEVGLFYVRHPDAARGHLFSITDKQMARIVRVSRGSMTPSS